MTKPNPTVEAALAEFENNPAAWHIDTRDDWLRATLTALLAAERERVWKLAHSRFFDITWDTLSKRRDYEELRLELNRIGDKYFTESALADGADLTGSPDVK